MPKPFLFALLGALLLGSAILALNLTEHDQARRLQHRSCGDMHWTVDHLPIHVRVDESAADWTAELQAGAAAWNRAAGRDVIVLEPALPAEWTTFADAFAGAGPDPTGRVLVVSGRGQGSIVRPDDADGHARINAHAGTCAITFGAIRVPDGEPLPLAARRTVAAHELGHALGMGESRDPLSVMGPKVMRPQPGEPVWTQTITDDDAALARAVGARPAEDAEASTVDVR